jgi:hypothetical protein
VSRTHSGLDVKQQYILGDRKYVPSAVQLHATARFPFLVRAQGDRPDVDIRPRHVLKAQPT